MPESSCCQEDGDACGPFITQEREIEKLVALLRLTEFGFNGRCPLCAGWNMSDRGETDKVHTLKCPVGNALAAYR